MTFTSTSCLGSATGQWTSVIFAYRYSRIFWNNLTKKKLTKFSSRAIFPVNPTKILGNKNETGAVKVAAPLSTPASCGTPKSCICEKRQKNTLTSSRQKHTSKNSGYPHVTNDKRRKNPVNQMKDELDKERSLYKNRRDFHKGIRNQHNKRGKRKRGDCKQRGMACFT